MNVFKLYRDNRAARKNFKQMVNALGNSCTYKRSNNTIEVAGIKYYFIGGGEVNRVKGMNVHKYIANVGVTDKLLTEVHRRYEITNRVNVVTPVAAAR